MIKLGTGESGAPDPFKAGAEACGTAVEAAGGRADIIFLFSTAAYDQKKMLAGAKSAAAGAELVGCSDAGEITERGPFFGRAAAMAVKSDSIKWALGAGRGAGSDSFKAGREAAEQVKKAAEGPVSLFISFLDGLAENGAAAVRGIQDVFGEDFPIVGGSAGDDFLFKKTYQYFKGEALGDSVVGVGLSGEFSFGIGVMHGWEPVGLPMKVTKSEGSRLIEIDGRPALCIYEDYFGKKAEELIKEPIAKLAYTYPLGMSVEGSQELLIRDVVIANKQGEITCAAEIPQGSEVRLMLGDPDKAVRSAKKAARSALEQLKGKKAAAIFVFDCIARRKLLGMRIGEEISAIKEVFGEDVPLIGFYTYGEQAPLGKAGPGRRSAFHNETIALLALAE